VIYHLQLYGLESGMNPQNLSRSDFSGRKPLLAAMTRENSYILSIFDVDRIVPGMPYVWQVQAYRGQNGLAASQYRMVFFGPPSPEPDGERKKSPTSDQTEGPEPGGNVSKAEADHVKP
jgi:hypothetical protein